MVAGFGFLICRWGLCVLYEFMMRILSFQVGKKVSDKKGESAAFICD